MDAHHVDRPLVGRRTTRLPGLKHVLALIACWVAAQSTGGSVLAADTEEAAALFRAGKYDECTAMCTEAIQRGSWDADWRLLKIRSDLARGRYAPALETLEEGMRRFPANLELRLLARDVYRFNNRPEQADAALAVVERLLQISPQRYSAPSDRVALGRYFLSRGADPRTVLERFYDAALKAEPRYIEAHLATAELALEKQDDALAASSLEKAPKEAQADPRYQFLLARAYASGDRARSEKAIDAALKLNPRHTESLLLRIDHLIDSERYDDAAQRIAEVVAVNPQEPRALAYRAVLAHLANDPKGEDEARKAALQAWNRNPEVDHLIGRKLSQKYRFAEGAAYQKQALELGPNYQPARIQLCQDLLRLGEEDEGWTVADEVFAQDGYNVLAYNLVTLRDRISKFRTLKGDGLIVRMDEREADLYGDRVIDLLTRARATLTQRYGVKVPDPVIVEIFPQKREFAVRTFGMPGAEGFLGVCFGRVITANSPASQGETPSNWEAVLWHEFCHVVTLSKTRNKMPRWLSEGISVYEEGRQDPAWGMAFDPHYREMLLGDDFVPLSRLSGAFLGAKSPMHLQFAYFESALAVEFLASKLSADGLNGLLDDLGSGLSVNDALPRRAKMSLKELDQQFASFARSRAEGIAPDATWDEPTLPLDADAAALSQWLVTHPKSFPGWKRLASRLVADARWQQAEAALQTLKNLYPRYIGPENAYVQLALVHRKTGNLAAERAVLEELIALDGNASPAYLRLMEMDEAAGKWSGVAAQARRLLAVNPLIPAPHRALAHAAEELGQINEAITAYRSLALVDDADPAGAHFKLARLLAKRGDHEGAHREVLRSLEAAPRFLEAHRLLLELTDAPSKPVRGPR